MNKISCAERIKQGLGIRDLKPADLCRMTDINRSTMSQYLSGAYEPSQVKLELISRALNVAEAWLMGYDVPMERVAGIDTDDEIYRMIAEAKANKGRAVVIGMGGKAEVLVMSEDELAMMRAMLEAYREQRDKA